MHIKEIIEKDLKTAMLAGDKLKVSTLRIVKSALLYTEVDQGKRDAGLAEEAVIAVLQKESKKRQESADLYRQGGNQERADAEEAEKIIIDSYLPKQLSNEEVVAIVEKAIGDTGASSVKDMGVVMTNIRLVIAGRADGSVVASIVRKALEK